MKKAKQIKQNRRFCQTMVGLAEQQFPSQLSKVLAYHQRSKHSVHHYAPGPASIDWEAQPSPYRNYPGCKLMALPFQQPSIPYSRLFDNSLPTTVVTLTAIAQLLEYGLSLSAKKVFGKDSWTVRCNPSSGNLHPTEAYLICGELDQLSPGVYHYQSQHHQLAQRATFSTTPLSPGECYIALSSVHWREAWKYGERAYRYCQLDVGHAIAALRYSAALLGWQLTIEEQLSDQQIAALCGIDRLDEYHGVEAESPDLLLRIGHSPLLTKQVISEIKKSAQWFGMPSLLDAHPFYEWQIIDQLTTACKKPETAPPRPAQARTTRHTITEKDAAILIKQRRSALAFQPDKTMSKGALLGILKALLPELRHLPFDLLTENPRLHPVLFIHRVDDLEPGLYTLPRNESAKQAMQSTMDKRFVWQQIDDQLPLYLLERGDAQSIAKRISCHQAIAAESAFSLGMLAEFGATLQHDGDAWRYRQLYWEAGIIGQTLYLEAEAHGYRGTGIGCFLDDLFHQLLGLQGQQFQSLYHFTVGTPVVDERISTLSPY